MTEQVHLAQNGAEHRKRRDTNRNADCGGEADRTDIGPDFGRVQRGKPQAAEKAGDCRHAETAGRDKGEGASTAHDPARFEMQPGDIAEQQHGHRGDTGDRGQRRRAEDEMKQLGSEAPETARPQRDPDKNLDADERHCMAQPEKPPQGDRHGQDYECLNQQCQLR